MKVKTLLLLSISFLGFNFSFGQNYETDSVGWELQKQAYKIQLENDGLLNETQINQRIVDFDRKREAYFLKKESARLKKISKESKARAQSQKKQQNSPLLDEKQLHSDYSNVIEKMVSFQNSSKQKEIQYKLNKSDELFVNIEGTVKSGIILIQIIDSKNKLHGEVEIERDFNGFFHRVIKNPNDGDWRVLLKPQNAEGEISVIFASKP